MGRATTRDGAVAGRIGPEGRTTRPARIPPRTLSVMSTRGTGWLARGSDRLTVIPLALRPWRGPENRSQFGARADSPVHAVRGGA